jgi:Zn finger protein HypA/HybF involved in hydrogenase expression
MKKKKKKTNRLCLNLKMHETVIINNILEEVKKKAKGKKIKSITIEAGELAHLPADELKELLTAIVDFEVIVKMVKAKVKCKCGYSGAPKVLVHQHDFVLFTCPKCGKAPKLLSGNNILLKKISTK